MILILPILCLIAVINLFYVVFVSLYLCIHAIFNVGVCVPSFCLYHRSNIRLCAPSLASLSFFVFIEVLPFISKLVPSIWQGRQTRCLSPWDSCSRFGFQKLSRSSEILFLYFFTLTKLTTYLGRTKMASRGINTRPHKFWLSVEFLKAYVQKTYRWQYNLSTLPRFWFHSQREDGANSTRIRPTKMKPS